MTEKAPNTPVLLNINEAAERLKTTPGALRVRIHEGTAPRSARVLGKRLFLESDVNEWIMKHFNDLDEDTKEDELP